MNRFEITEQIKKYRGRNIDVLGWVLMHRFEPPEIRYTAAICYRDEGEIWRIANVTTARQPDVSRIYRSADAVVKDLRSLDITEIHFHEFNEIEGAAL